MWVYLIKEDLWRVQLKTQLDDPVGDMDVPLVKLLQSTKIIFEVSTVFEKGYEQRPRSSTYDPSPGRLINYRCDDKGNIKQSLRIRMFRFRP